MKQVKLGLWSMSIPYLIQFCSLVVQMMTGNLSFLTPNPTLLTITAAIKALQDAYEAALLGGKTLKATQRINRLALIGLMSTLGAYVQEASNGDEQTILSSGMGVKKQRSPLGLLGQVANLRLKKNDSVGEASLLWNSLKGAKTYPVQTTQTPEVASSWVDAGLSTKRSITITGLPSGAYTWFRVAGFNAAGLGQWSSPVQKMIS